MDERSRKILEAEKDPRILRGLVEAILADNERLKGVIQKIEAEKAEREQRSFNIEEQVKLLRRNIFGKKSEKRTASDRPRDKSQQEAMAFSQAAFPSDENRKGQSNWDGEVREIEHVIAESELSEESTLRGVANQNPSQWVATGLFDQVTRIQIIERSYVKEIHKKMKYKLKEEFNPDPDKDVIITAEADPVLLPGMNYTTEFVASVVADKYVSHIPLERQTRQMESLGLSGMKTSTLSRFCGLAAAALEPLQEMILKQDLRPSDLALHLDETPWKIQVGQDGYMWVVSNRYGSYYFFKPTRSGKVIKEVLAGYKGPAVTDGYGGYNILEEEGIQQAFCWAHARRQFLPLEDHDPTVKPILDLIDELFAIEREAKSFDDLKVLRKEKSEPVLKRLNRVLLEERFNSRDGSQKRKGIDYITSRWNGFKFFVDDVRVPLSNNEAERTIRHAVMGRKNYYGSNNHAGAETAATLFTVIESCKKNDLDPRTFLLMSLDRAARGEELETPLAFARRTRSH